LEYDPQDIPFLLGPLLDDPQCAVYRPRYLANPIRIWRVRRIFELGVVILNWAVRWIYGVRLTDEATCYKLFSTEALRSMQLECQRFEFCPEVTAKANLIQIKIHEFPASYYSRTNDQGKKLRARNEWEAIVALWKYRHWSPRFAPTFNGRLVRYSGESPAIEGS